MEYTELRIPIIIDDETKELLPSILTELGFEGFIEEEDSLLGYIPSVHFDRHAVEELLQRLDIAPFFTFRTVPEQNWNAVWESQFEPVVIAEKCFVRAPFHFPQPHYPIELIIEPKMSFGTIHHETTAMMMEYLLEIDVMGKSILDVGTGTGILAILSAKIGAVNIVAIDNNEWAYRNALENIQLNNTPRIVVKQGDASLLSTMNEFDVILANINRNILLNDIPAYMKVLKQNGLLIVSGFYKDDLPVIDDAFHRVGLASCRIKERNSWLAAVYLKTLP